MNGDFEYSENFDAFLKMLNEQQNKIKSVLSDNANLLSLNTLKIPEINISKIDSDPLGAKLKGAFNIDVGAGKQLRSAVEREEKFEIFIDEIKNNLSNYETKIPILLLASCLIKFFEDSNWKNYPQKPEVINRHWLMHGMYDIDDITKSDCIKLLLMLNQLTDIYTKIKKGEL